MLSRQTNWVFPRPRSMKSSNGAKCRLRTICKWNVPMLVEYFEIQSKSWLLKYGRDILKPLCSWIIFDCMPYLISRQLLQFLDAGMTVLGKMRSGKCSLENYRSLWYFFVSNTFLRKFWSVNEIYFHWTQQFVYSIFDFQLYHLIIIIQWYVTNNAGQDLAIEAN